MSESYSGGIGKAATSVTPDASNGKVTVSATVKVPTTLLRIFLPSVTTIRATATAAEAASGRASEVVVALDTTGSMSGTKLSTAQDAAKTLVDTLFKQKGASGSLKVGFVPFDTYVNVGTTYRGASWLKNTNDYSTPNPPACWNTYPNAVKTGTVYQKRTCSNDGASYDCSGYSDTYNYGQPVQQCGPQGDSQYKWTGCVGSQIDPYDVGETATLLNPVPGMYNTTCSSPLVRLTSVPGDIKSQIAKLSAANETYIAPALTWAWRLLSPNSPFTGDAAAYGTANKTIVLMTDGANTRAPNYPQHWSSDVNLANQKLRQVCQNIKAKGITIYTIAFDVTDSSIKNLLANCASGPPFYYDASTNQALSNAFTSIAGQLTAVRITN
jgi:Mg-chelatase subunit ChlD